MGVVNAGNSSQRHGMRKNKTTRGQDCIKSAGVTFLSREIREVVITRDFSTCRLNARSVGRNP
jgi:hypothetical protein